VASQLSADAHAIAERNLRSAAESFRLVDAFADADVPLLFVKGLTLSALAYGDPFIKMSADVDILVDLAAVARAALILDALGYRPVVPSVEAASPALVSWHRTNKESAWYKASSDLVVELHTSLADNSLLISEIGMSSPRQLVPVGSGKSLPTLATPDLTAYLSVHGSSSTWFRLKWISDFAALLSQSGEAERERLYRHARRRGGGRSVPQAMLLASRLFDIEISEGLRRELERDLVSRFLARAALHELVQIREPTERILGTALIHLTQPMLLEGWGAKASEIRRQLSGLARR
jgi:hypothetical protein